MPFRLGPVEFRRMLNKTVDLVCTLDTDSRVVELGGRIFSRTNIDPALLTGQTFAETVFWQSSENTSVLLAKAFRAALKGEDQSLTIDFRISADEKIPLEMTILSTRLDEREPGLFVYANRAREIAGDAGEKVPETAQLLLAAENAEIGLWYWEKEGNKIFSTPRCNELLGLPPYESVSRESFLSAVHPDDREFVQEFLTRSQEDFSKYEEEFRVIYPDGDVEWICAEGKTFPQKDGQPVTTVGIVRKITDQKLAAEEISKVHEREKKARDEAIEANRAKDFFLAFVSHELRAPLNAILGWSKILLTKEVDEETRRNALETIERSARVQTKLINDLVDSARVASGKLRLEYRPTNLFELVRGSVQAQRPAAETRGIQLDFAADRDDVVIFGDVNRLQQVFGNLISNAIKFTPEGGAVNVSVLTDEASADIVIADTGQGISAEALPHIFRQFSQVEGNTGRNSAGLGLGLSIAKILAERHGGSVRAESEGQGKGSRFTVTLPLTSSAKEAVERAGTAVSEPVRSLKDLSILIVEDDPDSREVLQLFLEQSGAIVTAAVNVRNALGELEKMGDGLPDLIISDLAMPEEDGYSMIAKIRGMPDEKGGRLPAIALSAFATAESKEKAFRSGFDRYLTKPFEPDNLVAEIRELLREENHR
ncbi:MAG TPA: ATP-binding protein [Pyrinomonadaceae bacterium]|nr:ATP-binding protein [Pyrinomonadaceae bacterium]